MLWVCECGAGVVGLHRVWGYLLAVAYTVPEFGLALGVCSVCVCVLVLCGYLLAVAYTIPEFGLALGVCVLVLVLWVCWCCVCCLHCTRIWTSFGCVVFVCVCVCVCVYVCV